MVATFPDMCKTIGKVENVRPTLPDWGIPFRSLVSSKAKLGEKTELEEMAKTEEKTETGKQVQTELVEMAKLEEKLEPDEKNKLVVKMRMTI